MNSAQPVWTYFATSAAFRPWAPRHGRVDYRGVTSAPAVSVRPIWLDNYCPPLAIDGHRRIYLGSRGRWMSPSSPALPAVCVKGSIGNRQSTIVPHSQVSTLQEGDGRGSCPAELSGLKHSEDARSRVLLEADNGLVTLSEDGFDFAGCAIAAPDPNHFGWKAQNFGHLVEVRIVRDEEESMLPRIIPELCVGGPIQPKVVDVGRTWVEVGKTLDEAWRKVLVEEELHPFTTNCWRSRSAA